MHRVAAFKQFKTIINDYYEQGDITYIKTIAQSLVSTKMTLRYEVVIHSVATFFCALALVIAIWARFNGIKTVGIEIFWVITGCALFLGLCIGVLSETIVSLIYYSRLEKYCEDKTISYDRLSEV